MEPELFGLLMRFRPVTSATAREELGFAESDDAALVLTPGKLRTTCVRLFG